MDLFKGKGLDGPSGLEVGNGIELDGFSLGEDAFERESLVFQMPGNSGPVENPVLHAAPDSYSVFKKSLIMCENEFFYRRIAIAGNFRRMATRGADHFSIEDEKPQIATPDIFLNDP